MKTQINKNAAILNLTIFVSITHLEKEGWDFDGYHENTAEAMGISLDAARSYNYDNYTVELRITGTPEVPNVEYAWYNQDRNETTQFEDSGDDNLAIADITRLIDSGLVTIEDRKDLTVDADDNDVPTFVTQQIEVNFTNSNCDFVEVYGADTMDQAVTAADKFLESVRIDNEKAMCVKNGGRFYGDSTPADEYVRFNVG